jgi:alkanesulfonate monooxygenase SsuD/methylene tetrahydromethanopterin reductase-like flavin-dependent oxidoreductase (luciferase family)
MRFGLLIEGSARKGVTTRQIYDETVELIDAADRLGFDNFGCSEQHFWPTLGDLPSVATIPTPEIFYAYAARATKNLKIRTAIATLPVRPPLLIAEQVASLDLLSGGRMQFGTGRGNSIYASDAYGIPTAETYDRWQESLELIVGAWTSEDEFSWDGRFFTVPSLRFEPKPLQKPHPQLFYAALSPQSHVLAGELGQSLLTGTAGVTLEKLQMRIQMYRDAFRSAEKVIGKDPQESVSLTVLGHCTEDAATARREGEEAFVNYFLSATAVYSQTVHRLNSEVDFTRARGQYNYETMQETAMIVSGTPDTWTAKLTELADTGVDEVIVNFAGIEHSAALSAMELLSAEVMPKLR